MSRKKPFEIETPRAEYDYFGVSGGVGIDFEESIADIGSGSRLERSQDIGRYPLAVLVAGFGVFAVLSVQLFHLTINKHDEYQAIAEGNRLRTEYLPAPRGVIFDRRGEVLADSKPSAELVAIPLDLPRDEAAHNTVIVKVGVITSLGSDEIEKMIPDSGISQFETALIKQNLTREQSLILVEREQELPGFRVSSSPIRDYQRVPQAYAHLLGYVGKLTAGEYEANASAGYLFNDTIGKSGLELASETDLRGKFGERQVEVDARGNIKRIFGATDPVPGNDLVLNIDAALQDELYNNLTTRLLELGRRRASALAMDPRSGRILAYLSLPGYDNNKFAEGISSNDFQKLMSDRDQPLFNRAIAGIYPPGSTVKPMVAIAALEERVILPDTLIRDEGAIVIKNIYGGQDSVFIGYGRRALGILNVRKAIAVSSDIFFYIVGGGFGPAKIDGLGIERLAKYFRMFKINEKLGIDLGGEQAGLVPDPEWKQEYFAGDEFSAKWYLGDTYHVAIGQGDLLASPLHVLSWTATIANGGKIFRPFIVDRVEHDGMIIKQNEPKVIGEIAASRENIQIAQGGMREAVLSGTATSLQRLPITSAAKTGTAQFDSRDRNRSHAWFTAYAPFENPEIAITVMIEDGGEGGISSMPVVRDTLDWWAKNRFLP